MEQNLISNFKILITILRRIPLCMAICQFIYIILQFFGYNLEWMNYIFSSSLLTICFFYLSSYVFKFCYYHRISLHYIVITQILCLLDKYIDIPIDLTGLFLLHVILFSWLIISLIYFKYVKNSNT